MAYIRLPGSAFDWKTFVRMDYFSCCGAVLPVVFIIRNAVSSGAVSESEKHFGVFVPLAHTFVLLYSYRVYSVGFLCVFRRT